MDVKTDGMERMNERDWIEATLSGDKRAFGLLVERYKQQAYYAALGFLHYHEWALDISQEAFVRAYYNLNRFDTTKPFFPWLYRIIKNLSLNELRNRKKRQSKLEELAFLEVTEVADTPTRDVEQNEIRREVWVALERLNPRDREILVLREFQDYSYQQIADMLEIPVGTVMSRLYNARKALKHELADKIGDLL
ncbi:MAG: sigma-70 family RNA polymerase sigma factor [Calditrichaeota bacterium]|nr:MAG: sigma-70 family RNA polymerase sigma factor [Calditrichota bacterium]